MGRNASIRALPENVRAQIKSSAVINSINDVAIGLLKNALDAESSKVSITVDYARGGCDIEDDGTGIPLPAFEDGGSLGQMYHTSKFPGGSHTHGQYGQFLASVSSLSILTITSRPVNATAQPLMSFHRSHVITRREHNSDPQLLIPHAHGTIVTVKSLFGDLPVRVKQRATRYESSIAETVDLEELKKRVVGHLISWSQRCKVILRERGKDRKSVFNSQHLKEHIPVGGLNKDSSFHLPSICTLLRQAGYMQHSQLVSWKAISARSRDALIRAAICLSPSPNKQVQFVSIGINLLDTSRNPIIYDEVNKLFSLSDFGTVQNVKGDEHEEPFPRLKNRSHKEVGESWKRLNRLSKGVDKWPMFFIRIDPKQHLLRPQSQEAYGVDLESSQSTQPIFDLLRSLVLQFLEQHHFRPNKLRRRRMERSITDKDQRSLSTTISGAKDDLSDSSAENSNLSCFIADFKVNNFLNSRAPGMYSDGYQNWSRIKSSDTASIENLLSGLPGRNEAPPTLLQDNEGPQPYQPNLDFNISRGSSEIELVDAPWTPNNNENAPCDSAQLCENPKPDAIRLWTNPLSRQKVCINARTGQAIPETNAVRTEEKDKNFEKSRLLKRLPVTSWNRFGLPSSVSQDLAQRFIRNAFQDWDSPVFGETERSIPRIVLEKPSEGLADVYHARRIASSKSSSMMSSFFEQSSVAHGSKLSRSDLEKATVLGQVDHKFIVLKVDRSSNSGAEHGSQFPILAILDQHAADERCKVEQLLRDMFHSTEGGGCGEAEMSSVKVSELPKPVVFDASVKETQLFQQRESYFLSWGLRYKIAFPVKAPTATRSQNSTIVVTGVPSVVAERSRLQPELLIDILRSEVWSQHPLHVGSTAASANFSELMATSQPSDIWMTRLQTCPRGLIDMLNSRACRSAVMFSDVLSLDECRALVRKLAQCRFPFVCAHGRPSMAVLGRIPSYGIGQKWENGVYEQGEEGFVERCRDWLEA